MSPFLRDALVAMLFDEMARHIDKGAAFDEALIIGVREIRRQLRGSRAEFVEQLIQHASNNIHYAREYGMRMH